MSLKIKKVLSLFSLTATTFVLSARVDSYITPFNICIGVIIASCIWGYLIFFSKSYILYEIEKDNKIAITVLSVIGTIIWLWNDINFFLMMNDKYIQIVFVDKLGMSRVCGVRTAALILFLSSFYGTFLILCKMVSVCLSGVRYFVKTSDKIEIYYLITWTLVCGFFLMIVYTCSTAFYSGGIYNIIYTFDSNTIYNANSFMLIGQSENDIRQSLFAFFSLPISLPAYFLSIILPFKFSYAFFLQLFQDILIGSGIVLISRMLKLESRRKIAGFFFFSTMCETLLFTLLIEQYAILVFWLIVSVYCIANKIGDRELCAIAAVGTAPTSSIVLIWEYKNKGSFRAFFMYAIGSFFKFIIFLICLGQLGLVLNFFKNINSLMSYAGEINFLDKLKQYLYFVRSCFLGPASSITIWDAWDGGAVFRMNVVEGYNRVGILILVIILLSWLFLNKDIFINICFTWVGFSVLLMVGLGYCAASNDMFLFVHYFGWAMGSLLLIGISKLFKNDRDFEIIVYGISILMFIYNCSYFKMLIEFATIYYPLL